MRCLAVCQDELVIRMLDEILLPGFEVEFIVENRPLARRLHDAGVTVLTGDPRRTDTFLKADLGPGTCVKQGDTTFTDFLAQLGKNGNIANEAADDWEFKPGDFHVDAGATINAVNVGGEFHTFTRVADFGGGCVPVLNDILGLSPVPEFATSGVASGGMLEVDTTGLAPGTY